MSKEIMMQQAVTLHQAGCIEEAEQAYGAVLARWPNCGDALNLRGIALSKLGRHAEAHRYLRQAVRLQPGNPIWHHNFGKALHDAGFHPEAKQEYHAALSLSPDFHEALFNLGNLLKEEGSLEEAVATYRHLLRQDPRHGRALNNLGNTLSKLDQLKEAEDALRQALLACPDYADAQNNLGIVLARRGQFNSAIHAYERALSLNSEFPQANLNLGNSLLEIGHVNEAINAFEAAISQDPRLKESHNNLGNAYLAIGRFGDALRCYDQAIAIAPMDVDAHFNRALLYLLTGDFERGWIEYEWGLKDNLREPQRDFAQPRWNGTRFDGKCLLIVGEQGIGDVIQFVRYLPLAKARGGDVIVEVQLGLGSLLNRSFPDIHFFERKHDGHILPDFDLHCHLMSLPYILGHRKVSNIPATVPYLRADPLRIQAWRERLAAHTNRRIGLVWAGNPKHRNDRYRSIPLTELLTLTSVPDISLFSLQKGAGADQFSDFSDTGIIDLGPEIDDFEDTAAAIANLDLVVSVDTSVAHLAAALAKPTHILLSFIPDWRWQLGCDGTPWYPNARISRQRTRGHWEQVVTDLVRELSRPMIGEPSNRPSISDNHSQNYSQRSP